MSRPGFRGGCDYVVNLDAMCPKCGHRHTEVQDSPPPAKNPALNLLLRERDSLREALTRLHAWVLAQEGDCMYSGDHPIAQAAAAITGPVCHRRQPMCAKPDLMPCDCRTVCKRA